MKSYLLRRLWQSLLVLFGVSVVVFLILHLTGDPAALLLPPDATAEDIALTIHPHPTLGESIGMAAEVAHGSCTDVPPARR